MNSDECMCWPTPRTRADESGRQHGLYSWVAVRALAVRGRPGKFASTLPRLSSAPVVTKVGRTATNPSTARLFLRRPSLPAARAQILRLGSTSQLSPGIEDGRLGPSSQTGRASAQHDFDNDFTGHRAVAADGSGKSFDDAEKLLAAAAKLGQEAIVSKRTAKRAGIAKTISPHWLRHAHGARHLPRWRQR